MDAIKIQVGAVKDKAQILELYTANKWSAVKKPNLLLNGLENAHSLVTAWKNEKLVGLGNAISDGYLVVYYPHLLVHPDCHGDGIGRKIMEKMFEIYEGFHMQMLTSDAEAVGFYEKMGFSKAGGTTPMWIYSGNEHG